MGRIPTWSLVAAFLATVAVLAYRAIDHYPGDARAGGSDWAMADFRDTVYYPAVAVLDGVNPWTEQYAERYPVQRPLPPYGPVVILAHLPLGFLPVRVAEVAYFALSIGLTAVAAAFAVRACGRESSLRSVLLVATLVLLSRPGQQSLLAGQCTLEVVLGCYLGVVYGRLRPVLGALGIVIASMKPQFATPLVWLMIVRGDVRAIVMGIAVAGVLSLATLVAIGGFEGIDIWRAGIGRSNTTLADPALLWPRIDAGFLVRHGFALPSPVDALASLTVLVVGLFGFRMAAAADLRTATTHPLALTLACLTILLPLYHMAYDTVLLMLPVVALAAAPRAVSTRGYGVLLALLVVPAVNYLATNTVISRLEPMSVPWRVVTATNAAALVAAFLLASWLTLAGRRASPVPVARPASA